MYYSEGSSLWGFIAHIPIAIILLMFISRQVSLRGKGDSLQSKIFDRKNGEVLTKSIVGGIFGLVVLVLFSPISRFILS